MRITDSEAVKLVSAPSGNPPSGAVYQWYTTDGINQRTSAGVDSILANREQNVIINGGFDFYQRATDISVSNTVADDAYCFDRWYMLTQTAAGAAARPQAGATSVIPWWGRFVQPQAAAQRFGVAQIVEGMNTWSLHGQTVTLQARVWSNTPGTVIRYAILEWTGTKDAVTSDVVRDWTSGTYTANNFFLTSNLTVVAVGSTIPIGTENVAVALPGTVSTGQNLIVFFWTEAAAAQNVDLWVSQVDCHIGPVRAWNPRPVGEELALCQRYYEKSYDIDVAPGTNTSVGSYMSGGLGLTTARTATYITGSVRFNTPKRKAPISISSWDVSGTPSTCFRTTWGITAGNVGQPLTINNANSIGGFWLSSDSGSTDGMFICHWAAESEL